MAADTSHRLTRPLTDLLVATYGPLPVMSDLQSTIARVEQAFIYITETLPEVDAVLEAAAKVVGAMPVWG